MAYAGIAGVPPEAGLYTAPLALIGYAIFGSSRQLFVGPSSTVAILSAATVGGLVASDAATFWEATSWLAIITGAILVILGLVRMGWIANFMSQSVLDGFIVGLAITIAVGQLDKMFGVDAEGQSVVREFLDIIAQIGDWHLGSMAVGFVSLAVLFLMHKFTPKIPAALTVVIVAIVASTVFDFGGAGIHIVGDIPSGLPPIGLPGWPDGVLLGELIIGALAIVIVGYAESLAAARQYARKYGYQVDANQEMIGLGIANLGAGISQGFVVDGSLSKTAAGDSAGQKTQMAGLIAAVITIVTILFLTGLFFNLPEATLGAIVVHAVWKLINFKKLRRMMAVRKEDFYAGLISLVGVLIFGILEGVLIGVVLSLVILIYRASFPSATELGRVKVGDRETYVSFADTDDAQRQIGIVVHRFEADLIFSNANGFADSVREMLYESEPQAFAVVLDCEQMTVIDMTGAIALEDLTDELRDNDVSVHLARIHGDAFEVARRSGVLDKIGDANIHTTVAEAVDAALTAATSKGEN
jgi:high affinity sulfate transporter 1